MPHAPTQPLPLAHGRLPHISSFKRSLAKAEADANAPLMLPVSDKTLAPRDLYATLEAMLASGERGARDSVELLLAQLGYVWV